MTVYAVIAAYDEEKDVRKVIEKVVRYADRVIVVDDGSVNGTRREIEKTARNHPKVMLFSNYINRGKGYSLRYAYVCLKKNFDMDDDDTIVTIDSDGQHNPAEIPKLLLKVNSGVDIALGIRDKSGYSKRKRLGNVILSISTSIMTGTRLHDSECGFRCFRWDVLDKIHPLLRADGYGTEIEHIVLASKLGFSFGEVPISSHYIRGRGVTVVDGMKNFVLGLKTWMRRDLS